MLNDSNRWENASNPVSAINSEGILKLKIGSIIAILGNKLLPLNARFKILFISVIIDPLDTSEPVPEVVGIATIGNVPLRDLLFCQLYFLF